jgi:hypothetical protein
MSGRSAAGPTVERVDAELSFDLLIDLAGITVRNIDGDVALNGTAPSQPQYLQAARPPPSG